jgi:hypothetical protein
MASRNLTIALSSSQPTRPPYRRTQSRVCSNALLSADPCRRTTAPTQCSPRFYQYGLDRHRRPKATTRHRSNLPIAAATAILAQLAHGKSVRGQTPKTINQQARQDRGEPGSQHPTHHHCEPSLGPLRYSLRLRMMRGRPHPRTTMLLHKPRPHTRHIAKRPHTTRTNTTSR